MGGQLKETLGIENMVGQKYTEGARLAADLEAHLRAYPVEVLENRRVSQVSTGDRGDRKQLVLEGGERIVADTLIVATGAKWRELGVPGEREYIGRGVAFCPHCDGPFYAGKRVAVVGGGNSGVEAAIDLSGIAAHVTLVEYADALKARTTAIVGDGAKVTALAYDDRTTQEPKRLSLDGVFVQIGLVPNSAFLGDVVEKNRYGEIVVDAKGRTSAPGIYAAGDVTTVPFKQIVIAMGEGAKVALSAFEARTLGG
jgi:alkyl hydroperoxide reductase subunit F